MLPSPTLPSTESTPGDAPLSESCLLVTLIPTYQDPTGHRYLLGDMWKIDLEANLAYMPNLCLASPAILTDKLPTETVRIDHDPLFEQMTWIDLPAPETLWDAVLALPATIAILWPAIQSVDIVHAGVVGWPIPVGWVAAGIALVQRKFLMINIESAPWRIPAGTPFNLMAQLRAGFLERVNRWFVNQADLPMFTQKEYRQSLLRQPERGFLGRASWIDPAIVLSPEHALAKWQARQADPNRVLRVLFAARLVPEKGVRVLLAALQQMQQAGIPIELGILGQGDLYRECETVSQSLTGPTKLDLLGTVPYGPEFFQLVQTYDLLVVPNLQDEQPRIVYDVYSQAVPVLGSDNAGLRECVNDGETGILVPANQSEALSAQFQALAQNPQQLAQMGLAAREVASQMTHAYMHSSRREAIVAALKQKYAV